MKVALGRANDNGKRQWQTTMKTDVRMSRLPHSRFPNLPWAPPERLFYPVFNFVRSSTLSSLPTPTRQLKARQLQTRQLQTRQLQTA
jgi:hypothetical protein